MIEAYAVRRENRIFETSYFTHWQIAPHLQDSNKLKIQHISEPLLGKKEKNYTDLETLKNEKQFFEKLAKKAGEE